MLNYDLAERRNLSEDAVDDLEVLHDIMDCLVVNYLDEGVVHPKPVRKALKRIIEGVEYMMQEKWGFNRNRQRHTHWQRFEGLYKKRKPHYPRWSTTIQKAMSDE